MPLFTFECKDCGEAFEELVSFSQALDEIRCPNCSSSETHKKMSLVARTIRRADAPGRSRRPNGHGGQ